MNTEEKCRAILEKILALCDAQEVNKLTIGFGPEAKPFSFTVFHNNTHGDVKADDFPGLIDGLHALLESL